LVATPERPGYKLRRDVGFVGLVFASFGSIIGAGWLFGALFASSLAGPAAVVRGALKVRDRLPKTPAAATYHPVCSPPSVAD